jgi:hypothetical protein
MSTSKSIIRDILIALSAGTSAGGAYHCQSDADEQRPNHNTFRRIIPEANADLALRVRRNSQPRLRLDIPLAQVHVFLRTRVYDLDVDPLLLPRTDVRGDNDQGTVMCGVPYAFRWWVAERLQGKLDGVYWR